VSTQLGTGIAQATFAHQLSSRESTAPWWALHVICNHEKRVADHLAIRSVEHYLPRYTERSRWTDRTVTLERPLFPGYVFVRFVPEKRHSVITVPGVLNLLDHGGSIPVSDTELDRIRRALTDGCTLRSHRYVNVGTRVRVRAGVFEGTEGIVTQLRQNASVILSLSAIGQCFSLQLDLGDIEVLDGERSSSVPPLDSVA
jgi:transcription antitermination factor NusG